MPTVVLGVKLLWGVGSRTNGGNVRDVALLFFLLKQVNQRRCAPRESIKSQEYGSLKIGRPQKHNYHLRVSVLYHRRDTRLLTSSVFLNLWYYAP